MNFIFKLTIHVYNLAIDILGTAGMAHKTNFQ